MDYMAVFNSRMLVCAKFVINCGIMLVCTMYMYMYMQGTSFVQVFIHLMASEGQVKPHKFITHCHF